MGHSLLRELNVSYSKPMVMYCDNQSAIYIANNSVFHEQTKHIEVDCHFIRDAVLLGKIVTPHTMLEDQLVDIFTKALGPTCFFSLCIKLGMFDIYAPV